MSSLAAARADNFYYPPEWEPSKGGLNKARQPYFGVDDQGYNQ